jgi:microcin C transport system substrate-binding protein
MTCRWHKPYLILFLVVLLISGCSGGSKPAATSETASAPVAPTTPVSTNKDDYPVFPDADAGADPAVPAEQGGKGFKGEGWETNTNFALQGDPRAIKGGVFRDFRSDFPGTLRIFGPEANSEFNYGATVLLYESLLGVDPNTLEYLPALATHWQVSQDKMTFRFRINPNARFSDGMPVTAEDVVATYDFLMDPTLQAPMEKLTFEKLERPVAESKYILRVKAKELNWRNFLYFSGMAILPAHVLKTINGEKYVKDYNFKVLPGSGLYTIRDEDISKGKSISLRRRKDYWAEKARANVGTGNFDELRYTVVRDDNLAFEMMKKGDLDYYYFRPFRIKQWVEDTNFEAIQRGLIQKRKVFNEAPADTLGLAFNTQRPPYDDIRVRKAFTFLMNRPLMIEKLAFNEFQPLNSYFPGSVYENPNNPKNPYDPDLALKLLAEAGWKTRDAQGRLIKDGQPLQIEIMYSTQSYEPFLTVYQEDLRKVGVSVNLRLVTPETRFQLVSDRRFEVALMAWGGLLYPNPETQFDSKLADQKNNNNITGFKNKRVDELEKQYDKTFDVAERIRIIREIDGIVANDYQYANWWYSPSTRIIYWNKFGMPPGTLSKIGDYLTASQLWWIDPAKEARLNQALRNSSMKLEVGPTEDRYWLEQAKKPATN